MMNKKIYLAVFLILGVLLAACQPAVPTEVPPVDDDFEYGQDATVESLEVLMLESFPVQARVIVTGYLPDGCTELDEITVEREGQEFILTVITRKPTGDIVCTQALVPFEETVDLDIEGLEAGTYTVIAQDQQATFTLSVDNVFQPQVGDQDFEFGSNVTVESMQVNIMESFPVQVSVTLDGYLPDGCTEIHEITSARDGQTFVIDIRTKRPAGDVACTMAIVPFEENVSLDVEGLPAGEYTVIYGDLEESFTLDVDNVIPD